MEKNKNKVLNVRITDEEEKIIAELRDDCSVNISSCVRNYLKDLYANLTKFQKNYKAKYKYDN